MIKHLPDNPSNTFIRLRNSLISSTGKAIGAVIDAQDQGLIPPASVITRSGRGIWLLWLLQDPNGGLQRGLALLLLSLIAVILGYFITR